MHGTWQQTGGRMRAGAVVLLIAALFLFGAGSATALSGIADAALDLLLWIAGVVYGSVILAGIAWFATRGRRAERRAQSLAALSERQQAWKAEVEERHERRALTQARAQAQAWAPLIGAIAAAVRQPPEAQSVQVLRGEVER